MWIRTNDGRAGAARDRDPRVGLLTPRLGPITLAGEHDSGPTRKIPLPTKVNGIACGERISTASAASSEGTLNFVPPNGCSKRVGTCRSASSIRDGFVANCNTPAIALTNNYAGTSG